MILLARDPSTQALVDPRAPQCAGDFTEVFDEQPEEWDVVATCFFIDCAHNILEYVEIIADLLVVGGHWINFGPLLYHYADMDTDLSIELSYEELKASFATFGLEMVREETDLPSVYTAHPTSMLKQEYRCVSFTCVKKFHFVRPPPPPPPAPLREFHYVRKPPVGTPVEVIPSL